MRQSLTLKNTTMKSLIRCLLAAMLILWLAGCQSARRNPEDSPPPDAKHRPLAGTWKLLQGRLIENGDTTLTDYTGDTSFIKIINQDHFAFLEHTVQKDSASLFAAGGGHYSLKDSIYTEHLEYCNARQWENHDFSFTVTIKGDTLTQSGIEKIDSLGVNRINTEIYLRVQ